MYSNQNQTSFPPLPSVELDPNRKSKIENRKFQLRQHVGYWVLSHGNDQAILKHEIGLSYVSYLLSHPNEPIHGLALALKIRAMRNGQPADSAELIQERALALDDAEAARRLFRKQLELEQIVDDENQVEPVKEEASRQLQEIYEFQNKNPWRSRDHAQRAVRAVTMAIKRLHKHLEKASDVQGNANLTIRSFSEHLMAYVLTPSGRGGEAGGIRPQKGLAGCLVYKPPLGL